MNGLLFEPEIPIALWLPLALAAAGLLVFYAVNSRGRIQGRRRVGMLVLMALALAIPLILLLNPTWVTPIPPPAGKPALTILVDSTDSMAIRDAENGATRYSAAVQITREVAEQLEDQFDIQVWRVGDDVSLTDLSSLDSATPNAVLTDLGAAVEQVLDDRPQGQALLLLSDGVHNASGGAAVLRQSAAKARAMSAPVYVRTIGEKSGVQDLEVALRLPQEMAFTGQSVPVVVSIEQRGGLANQSQLSLLLNDQVVDTQVIQLSPDGRTEATFEITERESGLYRYDIRVDAIEGEVTDVNNSATLLLRVVDEPVRVLLLEGKPYWDTKFLIRTLASDPSVDLTTIVRMAEDRFLERHVATARSPDGQTDSQNQAATRSEQWATHSDFQQLLTADKDITTYQVVVLGRDAEVFLTDERVAQLRKWLIEKNGALVCFRGAPATQVSQQMAELMPVRWTPTRESRFRVRLTESGRAVHWLPHGNSEQELLTQLPSLATVAQPQRPKPLAVVLATTSATTQEATPIISYQPLGNGRVVVVEGAGMWRWAFLPPEHQQFDEAYGMLWHSLVRWLVANSGLLPSQQLALRSDKVYFSTTEQATATLLVRESASMAPPVVELTSDLLATPRQVTPIAVGSWPDQFRVAFGELPEGRYRARVAGSKDEISAVTAFDVRGNLSERLNVAARPDLMDVIATESGGAVLDSDDPHQLAQMVNERLSGSRPQRGVVRSSAWDRWWVLLSVYVLWASAWGLRRWSGLV